MKNIIALFILLITFSCSHQQNRPTFNIASANKGLIKNSSLGFPLFISQNLIEKDVPKEALLVHQGHFLKKENTKAMNESILHQLEENNFHLINLTLDDLAISIEQSINLNEFRRLIFLNSTISDVSKDQLYGEGNVVPYYIYNDIIFIGLSDKTISKDLNVDNFLVNDYVFSILKIKKITKEKNTKSYILIHNLSSTDMIEIMDRLPPTFINSLAD